MQAEPRNFLRIGAIMAVAVIAANCTVSVEDSGPHHPRPERPQICTREYAPVCGVRNSERQTFGNACEARSKGYRIIGSGKCSFQDRPDSGWDGRRDRPEQPRMCTAIRARLCPPRHFRPNFWQYLRGWQCGLPGDWRRTLLICPVPLQQSASTQMTHSGRTNSSSGARKCTLRIYCLLMSR